MLQWNGMLYLALFVQMVASISFDYGLASQNGANLGAMGIAFSSLSTNLILFIMTFLITVIKLQFTWKGKK